MNTPDDSELRAIKERYARRKGKVDLDRYSLLRPEVWQMLHERQRALWQVLAQYPGSPADWRLTEVGSGAGGNLLEMLRLGFRPENLSGIELLPERHAAARAALPETTQLTLGDAGQAALADESQDFVLQSTVFSSILDDGLQARLAAAMWRWLKPGGAVLWYDFIIDNPRNPDVRGVPVERLRQLFPAGRLRWERVTLAPPLARAVCRLHPAAYRVFNCVPWLRTHVLAVIDKP